MEIKQQPNTKLSLIIRQIIAYCIDMMIISFFISITFLYLFVGIESISSVVLFLAIILIPGYLYQPICERMFYGTIGMMIVRTSIVGKDGKSKIPIITAVRRHIARISFIWGCIGFTLYWLSFGNHFDDYQIIQRNRSDNPVEYN